MFKIFLYIVTILCHGHGHDHDHHGHDHDHGHHHDHHGHSHDHGHTHVTTISTAADFNKLLETKDYSFVKFQIDGCQQCQKAKKQFLQLSMRSHSQVQHYSLVEVNCHSVESVCTELKINKYPSAILFTKGQPNRDYNSTFQTQTMSEWLNERVNKQVQEKRKAILQQRQRQYDPNIQIISKQNLTQIFEQNKNVFLKFYAPWCDHCKSFTPVFKQVAKKLKDIHSKIVVGKVDCTVEKGLCYQYSIKTLPTLILFKTTEGELIQYQKGRSLQTIIDWLSDTITQQQGQTLKPTDLYQQDQQEEEQAETNVLIVEDQTSKQFFKNKNILVHYHAPWCPQCRKLATIYEEVANYFADQNPEIKVAAIDCSKAKETCTRNAVKEYPQIVLYRKKQDPIIYNNKRSKDQIIRWVQKNLGNKIQDNQL